MTDQSIPDLLKAIRQGIEASGQALLAEARQTGQPLVTWRDGHVVLVDADGRPLAEQPQFQASSEPPARNGGGS